MTHAVMSGIVHRETLTTLDLERQNGPAPTTGRKGKTPMSEATAADIVRVALEMGGRVNRRMLKGRFGHMTLTQFNNLVQAAATAGNISVLNDETICVVRGQAYGRPNPPRLDGPTPK